MDRRRITVRNRGKEDTKGITEGGDKRYYDIEDRDVEGDGKRLGMRKNRGKDNLTLDLR